MTLPAHKPGLSCLLFVALLMLFNWPVLSIPEPKNLFGWLFAVWGVAILLLFLAARGSAGGNEAKKPPQAPGQEKTGQDSETARV
jgi:hypothetical protein